MAVSIRPAGELVRLRYELTTAAWLALESLRAHKLRSFLTLLGVIIGVASVVLVGAAIDGLGAYAEQSTAKVLGSETFQVARIAVLRSRKEFFEKIRRNKPIRLDDFRYLVSATGDRVLYSAYNQRSEDVRRENQVFEDATILGASAVMPELRDINLTEGRFFTEQEERTRQNVAVIGQDIRARLFPGSSAIGRAIRVRGQDFAVLGVQERLGSVMGRSQDNQVYIPFSVMVRMYGAGLPPIIFGKPRPGAGLSLQDALDLARVALRTRFHTRPGEPDRFDTVTPDAVRSFIDQILAMIASVVVPVTSMALLVGGIVIMNIMLVSVTERTHEIGIRKSLGARPGDIRLQFLLEATLLAAAGGAAGVLTGAVFTAVLGRLFEITMRMSLFYVVLALGISSAVGIVSGWYPAMRAARLDPIVALRSE